MKKLLVVMVITLMMTSGAYALQADWQVDFTVEGAGVSNMNTASIGAAVGMSEDGADFMDAEYPAPLAGTWELDIVNAAAGLRGQTDFIAPPTAVTDVDIWQLKLYTNGGAAGTANVVAKFNDFDGAYPLNDAEFFCYLFAGNFADEAALKAATAAPIWTGSLANIQDFKAGFSAPVALAAGGNQYYTFWAGAEYVVPEPGSMLALFSGLVGLVGFGIRRRR